MRDRSGKVIGASKVGRDITEREQAEKLQRVLNDELAHRVKNTLATVQAIASRWFARRSPTDFVSSFTDRVQALVKAHTLLTRDQDAGRGCDGARERASLDRRPQ
jgi:two-component sensor histidine kinase